MRTTAMIFSGIIGAILVSSLACGGAAAPTATRAPTATTRPAATTPPVAGTQPPAPATACSADAMVIGPLDETLKFDKDKLSAKAGSQMKVCLKNISTVNDHNWVLVKQGTKDAVATLGVTAGAASDWVPTSDNVLAKTKLIAKGQTGEVALTVPAVGQYQYVCTFPGHGATMFGEFEATP